MEVIGDRWLVLGLLLVGVLPLAGQEQVHHETLPSVPILRPAQSPDVSIGEAGGPDYELFRVNGAVRLSDGRIVILNTGTNEIKVFSPEGAFLASHGRTGQGPGEFTLPLGIFASANDSIFVWDSGQRRASIFSADGGFSRTVTLDPVPLGPRLVGVTSAGDLLILGVQYDGPGRGEIGRFEEHRFLYRSTGERADSLGQSPGRSAVLRRMGQGLSLAAMHAPATTTYAIGSGYLWVETGEDHGVEVWDLATGVGRLITWEGASLRMTDEYLDAILKQRLANVDGPEAQRFIRSTHEARATPERIPATAQVLSDELGRGWVEMFPPPGGTDDSEWLVFTPEGELVQELRVPRGLKVLSVHDGELLVVERDGLGVEYMRIYKLMS